MPGARDPYRDELGAAHARIAELERELASMKGQAEPTLAPRDPLARMFEMRRALIRANQPSALNRSALTSAAIVMAMCGGIGLYTGMLSVVLAGVIVAVFSSVMVRFVAPAGTRRDIEMLDARIASLQRVRAMAGATGVRVEGEGPFVLDGSAGVRVVADEDPVGAQQEADEAAELEAAEELGVRHARSE